MSAHPRWPPERFYWAVLEAPPCRGELPVGLRSALEELIPDEHIHAVCTTLSPGRVVVCALPMRTLTELEPGALSLGPERAPAYIGPAAIELNLLVGAMEPPPIRRGRTVRRLILQVSAVCCCGLMSVGWMRRAQHWDRVGDRRELATRQVIDEVLPGASSAELSLAVRRASAVDQTGTDLPQDATRGLADLLGAWPAGTNAKPLSIAVNQAGIYLSVVVDGPPASFLDAFTPPRSWSLKEPRLVAAGDLTRLDLALQRVQEVRP